MGLLLVGLDSYASNRLWDLYEQEEYEVLIQESFSALDTCQSAQSKSEVYKIIGNAFFALSEYEKAIEYYNLSIEAYEQSKVWSNKGVAQFYLGDNLSAIESQKRALEIAQSERQKAIALNNLAIVNMDLNRYDEAFQLLDSIEVIFKELNDTGSLLEVHFNQAEILLEQNKTAQAKAIFLSLLDEVDILALNYSDLESDVYYHLFLLALKEDNSDKAFEYHSRWRTLKDSLQTRELKEQLFGMEEKYQNKILLLENEKKTNQIRIITLGGAGAMAILVLSMVLYFTIRANYRLRMFKSFIDRNDFELKRFSEILFDDLANLMVAAKYQVQSGDPKLEGTLDQGIEKLTAVARRLYSIDVETKGIKIALEELAESYEKLFPVCIELDFSAIRNMQHLPNESRLYACMQDLFIAIREEKRVKIRLNRQVDSTEVQMTFERDAQPFRLIVEPRVIGLSKIAVHRNTLNLLLYDKSGIG